MKTPIIIQLIPAEQTYALRHCVLRPHQDFSAVRYPGDFTEGAFHVGAISDEIIVCVASFHRQNSQGIKDLAIARQPYQLRGMATDNDFRGQGIGAAVLQFAVNELQRQACDLLWCNAREIAFPFYVKCGFTAVGDFFEIKTIGPHKVMYKFL